MAVKQVIRGGSWHNVGRVCQCVFRDQNGPVNCDDDLGFRLVAELSVKRATRGGSWYSQVYNCRATSKYLDLPKSINDNLGFRLIT